MSASAETTEENAADADEVQGGMRRRLMGLPDAFEGGKRGADASATPRRRRPRPQAEPVRDDATSGSASAEEGALSRRQRKRQRQQAKRAEREGAPAAGLAPGYYVDENGQWYLLDADGRWSVCHVPDGGSIEVVTDPLSGPWLVQSLPTTAGSDGTDAVPDDLAPTGVAPRWYRQHMRFDAADDGAAAIVESVSVAPETDADEAHGEAEGEDEGDEGGIEEEEEEEEDARTRKAAKRRARADQPQPGSMPAKLKKYWHQRYLLFERYDDGIQMDEGAHTSPAHHPDPQPQPCPTLKPARPNLTRVLSVAWAHRGVVLGHAGADRGPHCAALCVRRDRGRLLRRGRQHDPVCAHLQAGDCDRH